MCGICGTIGYSDYSYVDRMSQRMVHRGPDDIGVWHEDNVYLGHTRLSIIDVSSAGHQPMSNEDGTVWITYNGEIYNFKALRTELEKKGHRFKSNTDTEVIVHLYEEYGEACLEYLRGMFSFAIWDNRKNRLFAARDRFGIKPFFYHYRDGKFIFASELRAILGSGLVEKDINPDALADYFAFGSVQAPDTLIKNIFQLLPGHYLILESGQLKIEKYWEVKNVCGFAGVRVREKEYIAEIRAILDEAVRIRMISDVPMGVFLSGGIDSGTIVSLMQKNSSRPIKTFSVIFEEAEYDEREFSNRIARKFGTEHRQILLKEKDILKEMPKIFDVMDQPSADGFNTFIISKAVKEAGLTVALSGLGGDELFAGYPSFRTLPRVARMLKCARYIPGKQQLFSLLTRGMKSRRGLKAAASLLKCGDIYDLYLLQRMVFLEEDRRDILVSPIGGVGKPRLSKFCDGIDSINLLSYLELTGYLRNTLLQDTDRMSMANSLEARVPFLDHLLVEKMFEIPGHFKVGSDYPKRLLVLAMEDLLPKEVYQRPKMGFVLPFEKWLRGGLKGYCADRISQARNIPVSNSQEISKIWASFLNGSRLYNYSSILTIVSFINWYEKNMRG